MRPWYQAAASSMVAVLAASMLAMPAWAANSQLPEADVLTPRMLPADGASSAGTAGLGWQPSPEEMARTKAALDASLPEGAKPADSERFYAEKLGLARRLGDHELQLKVLDGWLSTLPNSIEAQTQHCFWMLSYGQRQQAVEECQALAGRGVDKYYLYHELSSIFLDEDNFKESARLIDLGQQAINREEKRVYRPHNPVPPLYLHRIQLEQLMLRARWLNQQGKYREATELLTDSPTPAAALLAEAEAQENTWWQRIAYQTYANYLQDKVRLELALDNADSALQDLWRLNSFLHAHPINQSSFTLARLEVDYLKYTGHFQAALERLHAMQNGMQDLSVINSQTIFTQNRQVNVLLGLERWDEAAALLDSMDRSVVNDPALSKKLPGGLLRSLLALQSGAATKAEQLARRNLASTNRNFGPDHFYTRRAAGMLAAALWQQHQAQQAAPLFQQALEGFLMPQGVTMAEMESGLNPLYRRFILSAYLDMLAGQQSSTSQAAAFDTSFRIGDLLRNSTVQQSVSDSAARAVAGQNGLGELVRAEQDAQYSLQALYGLLDTQLQKTAAEQNAARIDELRQQITQTQKQLAQSQSTLHRQFARFEQLTHPQPPGVKDVQAMLQAGEALISALALQDKLYVWAIAADGRTAFHVQTMPEQALEQRVDALRATLDPEQNHGHLQHFDHADALALYQQLLAPVHSAWQGQNALIFSVNGALGRLPMSLLLTAQPAQVDDMTTLPWLIREVAVSHIPSVSSLQALRQLPPARHEQRKALLAFGDPLFDLHRSQVTPAQLRTLSLPRNMDAQLAGALLNSYGQVPPLPETREEIAAIASALKADMQQDVFLGEAATRKQVMSMRLDDRAVIDFSTHGLVAGDLPGLNQPALAMAATDVPGESPLLTLQDVMQLKLNADWVVLSACNTAAADGKSREAISGLGRGFFYAGTRSLLLTYWSVESDSARELVSQVFRTASSGSSSRSESLRQAQLKLIQQGRYAHPTFWAAYALVGDGGR
ncbi:MAG: CHAT domain-containing protein [Aquitalea sp.]|nr:CHAT domain-containing protein [Aquitalea sp.]